MAKQQNKQTPVKAEEAPIVEEGSVAVTEATPEQVAEAEKAAQAAATETTPVETAPVETAPTETQSPADAYETPVAVEQQVPTKQDTQAQSTGNQVADYVLLELEQYAEAMKPGKEQSGNAGAVNQLKLFRIIERVFNRVEEGDFKQCMDALTGWFTKHNKGVTSEAYLYRYAAEWSASADEFAAFTRFCNLLFLASDTKSREMLTKDLNFEFYLEYGLTENGRNRVLSYFGK